MSIEWLALGFSIFVLAMGIFVWLIIKWMDKRTFRLLREATIRDKEVSESAEV